MRKILIFAWETIKIIIISLAIIIPVRYYLVQPFFVRGASMTPNFDNGQYLVINEISYRFEEPQREEVIVFKYPSDPSQYYIKRIIGLPGETVEIKDGQVIIYNQEFPQGRILDESSYLAARTITWGEVKVELSEEEYFVLGDNRQASSDSRRWGALPREYIIGRVWLRAWPFNSAKVF
jgi:signal peptidase I